MTSERWNELDKAISEGRLVILPCAPGSDVWRLCPVGRHIKIGDRRNGEIVTNNCQRCPYGTCGCYDIAPEHATEITKQSAVNLRYIIHHMDAFGKVIFLSLEEAEEALKKARS